MYGFCFKMLCMSLYVFGFSGMHCTALKPPFKGTKCRHTCMGMLVHSTVCMYV